MRGGEKDRGPRVRMGGNERDAQMVAQYPRAENAQGEEVAAQAGVAAEKAGDGFIAIFCVVRQLVSRMVSWGGRHAGLPFRATMFHAVGLNVIDARERKRDTLDASTKVMRDMTDRLLTSWLRTDQSESSYVAKNVQHCHTVLYCIDRIFLSYVLYVLSSCEILSSHRHYKGVLLIILYMVWLLESRQ